MAFTSKGIRAVTLLIIIGAALAGACLITAAFLIGSTGRMERLTARIGVAVNSVYAGEQASRMLLMHARETPASSTAEREEQQAKRAAAAQEMERWIGMLDGYAESPEEQILTRLVQKSSSEYLQAHAQAEAEQLPPDRVAERVAATLEQTLHALDDIVRLNYEQSLHLQESSRLENAHADLVGWGVAASVVLLLASVYVVLHHEVKLPLSRLQRQLRNLAPGKLTPIRQEGPAELREITGVLNDLLEQVQRNRQTQLRFLAGIAHDLRTPLNAMKLATTLLDAGPLGKDERETLSAIEAQISQLDRQVGDLLDTARIESGNLELRLSACDLSELATRSVRVFSGVSARHTVTIDLPETPLLCECDPTRIGQVLNNLLSNALKYSPDGGEVKVQAAEADGTISLSVTDEGMGIAPEDLPHVFEPFRRSAATRDMVPGVGLGLSVAKRIVEAHAGTILVESKPRAGSRFTVQLPRLDVSY